MSRQEINQVLEKLHNISDRPRLEIEGAGRPSIQALYLNWIVWKKDGEGKAAVWVVDDSYTDTSFVTSYDTECIKLEKSGIESLVEYAISSNGRAEILTKGIHMFHNEFRDDYSDHVSGSPVKLSEVLLELRVDLNGDKPKFNLNQVPFVNYPKDIPQVAIANRIPLCINCSHVWLEPFGGREPDFNHCSPMVETSETYRSLNREQKEKLDDLCSRGVLCPFFEQTRRYSVG